MNTLISLTRIEIETLRRDDPEEDPVCPVPVDSKAAEELALAAMVFMLVRVICEGRRDVKNVFEKGI